MRAWLRPSCRRRLDNSVIIIPSSSFIRSRTSHHDHHHHHHRLHPGISSSSSSSSSSIAALLSRRAEAESVTVHGWVRSVRRQKKIAFAAIGDGSSLDSVQVVLKPEDAAQLVTTPRLPLPALPRKLHL